MTTEKRENGILIKDAEHFRLGQTLDCGQAFRWETDESGAWHGVVSSRVLTVRETEEGILLENIGEQELGFWLDYFDLSRDYGEIQLGFASDLHLKSAMEFCGGIRILRQDTWEALCSFIISQNNNIPRIKGIIDRLCRGFGEKLAEDRYSFPTAEALADLSESDLAPLRSGFRAKYIIDAAKKVSSGEIPLESLTAMPIEQARRELMKIKGVGPKVAECTLLYGAGRLEAFPVDVWVKRLLGELYPEGFPFLETPYAGIAQQYLFHYRRFSPDFE